MASATFDGDLTGRTGLVVGAGAMGALSVATLTRSGVGPLEITNRGADRAERLAEAYGATAVPFDSLDAAIAAADIVVCATASTEPLLTASALAGRERPLVVLDLAVPRDVAPDVADLPNVTVVDIDGLATTRRTMPAAAETLAVEQIVAAEVDHFMAWLRGAEIAPTVAALRTRADEVVSGELRKLTTRRPEFTEEQRADVSRTLHRVVQQLLHSPTVRVRQLAAEPGGDQYAALLRELFDLDVPHATQADAVPEIGGQE
nr:hypothetical protein GCM10020092_009230 [Actinoplanes digitatis]